MESDLLKSKHFCSVRNKTFSSKGNLTRHFNAVHASLNEIYKEKSQGGFSCTTCGETFSLKSSLTRHHREVYFNTDDTVVIVCPACGDTFTRNSNLFTHLDTKHGGESGMCSMLVTSKFFMSIKMIKNKF